MIELIWHFLFYSHPGEMAAVTAQVALAIWGLAASKHSANQSASTARKLNKRSAEASRQALDLAKQNQEFAKEQYDLFAPAIQGVADFFSKTPLDDIASGRVASRRSEPVIRAINEGTEESNRILDRDLAQRGLSDSEAGILSKQENERNRITSIGNEAGRSIDKDISNNLALLNQAMGFLPGVNNANAGILSVLNSDANRSNTNAATASENASRAGASAFSALGEIANNSNIEDINLFGKDGIFRGGGEKAITRRPKTLIGAGG